MTVSPNETASLFSFFSLSFLPNIILCGWQHIKIQWLTLHIFLFLFFAATGPMLMFWCLSCLCDTNPAVLTTSPRCWSCLWRKCSMVVCRQSWCTSCRCLPHPKCTALRQTYLWRNMIWRMLLVVMIPLSKFLAKRYAGTVGEDWSFFVGGKAWGQIVMCRSSVWFSCYSCHVCYCLNGCTVEWVWLNLL